MVDHYKVKDAILRQLRDEHGEDALTQRPIKGTSTGLTHTEPTSYLTGMKTALQTARAAENLARDWARDARGNGKGWGDIADRVGQMIPHVYDDAPIDAFLWVAPRPSMPHDAVSVGWRCESCAQWVTDHGPYNRHPADNETGHALDCARHNTEIAAYMATWDDDEA